MKRAAGAEHEILRSAGLRVTPQRVAILKLLRGTRAHPSPEMVYRELKPAYPGLSLNTVYQTLHALEKAGVLRRISMEENVYRFDANVAPHVHLVCRGCGRVDDCNGDLEPLLEHLGREVAARCAWDIRAQDSCFYGYCPGCRSEGKPPKPREEV
ncbi:MAG: transcriptional repressor [Firmicutes bacterium]|nr:transcriptional repressor [Bacillota bacterium]